MVFENPYANQPENNPSKLELYTAFAAAAGKLILELVLTTAAVLLIIFGIIKVISS